MNKKFKRLISVILTVMMAIGMMPFSGLTMVSAATPTTIYFDAQNVTASTPITARFSGNMQNQDVTMTHVSGTIYSASVPSGKTHVMFIGANGNWYANGSSWPQIPTDGKNMFVSGGYGSNAGYWTTYNSGTPTDTVGTYFAPVDLVDYFNDTRVDDGSSSDYSTNNQGASFDPRGSDSAAFEYLNRALSGNAGTSSGQYSKPLYFGSLLHIENRVGRSYKQGDHTALNRWNSTINVALTNTSNTGNYNASVQGLVGNTLSSSGNLVDPVTGKTLPYFSKTAADTWTVSGGTNKLMAYYKDYQFPFKAEKIQGSTVTKYSYDSASDYAVFIDWDNRNNKQLVQAKSGHVVNNDGNNGYFPLNKAGDSGAARNYGFGTKFTIPFTVNENGTIDGTENGEAITFKFTGDDDVWVFLDGKLILDMGGAHGKASGSINFKTLQATADNAVAAGSYDDQYISGNSNDRNSYVNQGLKNYVDSNAERSTVSSGVQTKNFSDYGADFANSFHDSSKTHTLTMFYMERGMFDSNMKLEFTINPLPSGLSLSKDVEVENVNDGLKDVAKTLDAFNFTMTDNNTDTDITGTDKEYAYTIDRNGTGTYDATTENGVVTGVSDSAYAKDFEYANGNSLTVGTNFTITETVDSGKYDTRWFVTNLKATDTTKPEHEGSGTTANFDLGEASEDPFATASYNVNFVNTMKVGTVSVKKHWNGTVPESLTNTDFDFKVEVDLSGTGNSYQTYALDYTSDQAGRDGKTNSDGSFKIKAGETVTFDGIPVGAKVRVTETTTSGDSWTVDGEASKESSALTAGSRVLLTITNKTNEIEVNKVIYIEAGKYTEYIPSEHLSEYESLTVPEGSNLKVDKDAKTFHTPYANEKHTVSYTGTKADGTNVRGTITVYSYKATDKVYVFDYGLKSNIAATNGKDGLFEGGVFNNTNATGDDKATATLGAVTGDSSNTQTAITASGDLTIKDDNSITGSVTFEPKAFMDKVENYSYTANIKKDSATELTTNPETGTVVNGTIKVMPASVVYYEDNFANEITYTGDTIVNNTPIALTQSNDLSELYGHDDAYAAGTGDSAGGSTQMKKGAKATFTFKGTGFDLIARTSKNTGSIVYKVKDVTSGTVKYYGAVDTYYNNGDLYQLPVLSVKNMDYGTYEVTILVVASSMDDANTTFYLDGVRIYDPAGDTLNGNYIPNEAGAEIKDIRQMILGDCEITEKGIVDESGSYITSAEVAGSTASVLYYDGDEKALEFFGDMNQEDIGSEEGPTYSASLAEYLRRGPANEVYLGANSGVAFVVKADDTADPTFQVEAKLVQLSTGGDGSTPTLYMLNASKEKTSISAINTNTAMYYDIPVNNAISLGNDNYLVVLTGDETATDCISMTNLKVKGYTVSSPADASNAELVKDVITSSTVEPAPEDYAVDVDFVKFENTVTKGKLVKAIVEVPEGSQIDGFQVYANDNAVTTKMEKVQNSNTQYRVSFMMTNAKGNYTLKFVPYKLDTDGTTKVESVTYLSKSITVRR